MVWGKQPKIEWNKKMGGSVFKFRIIHQEELTMNKKQSIITISVLLIGAMLIAACSALPASTLRTLAVTGTGKVILVPDLAYINIGVRGEEADITAALNANNNLASAITAALQAEGVDAKDIQTANFNVFPSDQYDPTTGQYIQRNYAVENTLYITVRDLPALGKLLDTALKAGANSIYGISFDIADKQTALAQARDLAIADAKAKAEATAAAAGVELLQIQTINVTNTSFVQGYNQAMGGTGGAERAIDSTVPIAAGQVVITFDANLIYEIK